MHRSLMLPSRFRSSACSFSTPARTSAALLTGYSLSVLSSSALGHSQVGHTITELSAVAAISSPSMLMMCQNAFPGRTNLSHQSIVHVVVDLICIKVWMVKDHLYQIFQFCCVDIVLTNLILQNAFAP